jgi:protein-L-isoaspartate(D-aspartate) O-methyltransferase
MGVRVYTIERYRELYVKAQKILTSLGYNINFFFGDGFEGKSQYGPYDAILITAAVNSVPETLLGQLKIGGRLVVPLGGSDMQVMTVVTRLDNDDYEYTSHGNFVFVPMLRGTVNG